MEKRNGQGNGNNLSQPDLLNAFSQQNIFTFDEISIDSRFDGGNLMLAEKVSPGMYNLWISPDCYKTEFETKHKVWFFFKAFNINYGNEVKKTFIFKIKKRRNIPISGHCILRLLILSKI